MVINRFVGPYRFLSNFWPAEVDLEGEIYPTVEHAYQAAKVPYAATYQVYLTNWGYEIPPGILLGCYCAPRPCHGDVIADFLNRARA